MNANPYESPTSSQQSRNTGRSTGTLLAFLIGRFFGYGLLWWAVYAFVLKGMLGWELYIRFPGSNIGIVL